MSASEAPTLSIYSSVPLIELSSSSSSSLAPFPVEKVELLSSHRTLPEDTTTIDELAECLINYDCTARKFCLIPIFYGTDNQVNEPLFTAFESSVLCFCCNNQHIEFDTNLREKVILCVTSKLPTITPREKNHVQVLVEAVAKRIVADQLLTTCCCCVILNKEKK